MRNPIKIIRTMTMEYITKDCVDFEFENLERIMKDAQIPLVKSRKGCRTFFKVREIIPKTLFISGKEEECKFASISDLHFGFVATDSSRLEKFLRRAQKLGVKYCCISGDVHEGINIYPGQNLFLKEKLPEKQAEIAFEVLRKFNFTYIIIDGNHDLSFQANGLNNPNEILEEKLASVGIKAYYLRTFVANVIIGGVCIRLIHLDDHYGRKENIPCLKYYSEVKKHPYIKYNNEVYLVSCIQTGHIHIHSYFDMINYNYCDKKVRQASRKEILNKMGNGPLLVLQPGTIKRHLVDERMEIGFVTKISLNDRGNPCSYEIV